MSQVDRLLKDARAAIAAKEYSAAVEICQNALKLKKNSYMALVLLGAALQDRKEAKAVFHKAISLKLTTPLAYQGLAKFYEKLGDRESMRALLETYYKLLELDLENCSSVCDQIYDTAVKIDECKSCADILYRAALQESSDERREILYICLVKTVSSIGDAPWEDMILLYEKVINLIPHTELIEKICYAYFQCVYVNKGYNEMLETSLLLLKTHNSTRLSEFICKSFCEAYILKFIHDVNIEEIEYVFEKLINDNPNSNIGKVTQGVIQLIKKKNLYAYNSSIVARNEQKNNHLFPLFHGQCCVALGRWLEAEHSVKTLICHSDPSYSRCALSILIAALGSQDDIKQCSKAIELSKTRDISLSDVEYTALFRAYTKLNLYSDAEECLNKVKNVNERQSLSAILLHKRGKPNEAFNLISQNADNVSCCIVLGELCKELKDYKTAVDFLIKAATEESHNYRIYMLLGECYMLLENFEKAKKCLQRALDLNPECSFAGKMLSKIYMKLREWGSNYELLKTLMDSVSHLNPVPFQWIWFQLGLHYVALEQWDDAIGNWRIYIRLNSSDIDAWEMLAEAYFSRGSYTSALKCFNKVVDMDSKRKYCYVQIGTIENMLGLLDESVKTFIKISDGEYLPALKGLAEVKISIARDKLTQNSFGLCKDNAQEAIDLISLAISKDPRLSCLWQILYEAITIVINLPTKYCWLYFSPEMTRATVRKYSVNDMHLLAMQCIEKAIGVATTTCTYLYHELATAYFKYFEFSKDLLYGKKAYIIAQKCIECDMKVWQYWNLFGVICGSRGMKKNTLAQHAFIKGLDLDPCNPTLWSNLGVLYLITGHSIMANRSFMKAQESDPSFIQSWIGQALIAELIGHEDALDLFRHASTLGFHKESSFGYAYWVANKLVCSDEKIGSNLTYSIEHMHAIPDACDLISLYNQFDGENACSWNIYGILLEKLGKYNNAIDAFIKSLKYVDLDKKDLVLLNLARLYFKSENYSSAIETIKNISAPCCNVVCLLADCYWKNGQVTEAYLSYNKVLKYYTVENETKAEVLMALSNIAFKCHDKENAELLIFQCINLQPSALLLADALSALCAMSILFKDKPLSYLALKKLKKLNTPSLNILRLQTYILFQFEGPNSAIKYISSYIKTSPNNPHMWQLMSTISTHNLAIINISAKKAIYYGEPVEFVSLLKLACISELKIGSYKKSKVLAQKATMYNPGNAENWSLLVNVLLQNRDETQTSAINEWLKNVVYRIIHNFSMKTVLFNWYTSILDNITVL